MYVKKGADMKNLTIEKEDDLYELVEKALDDVGVLSETNVIISPDLQRLTIHFEGDYDASITPQIMRSLLVIQDSYYELYSVSKYGYKKRLTEEERESVEFVAAVKPGSAVVDVIFEKAVEVLATMTGEQALATVGILCGTFLIGTLGKRAFDYFEKKKELEQRSSETEGNQKLFIDTVKTCLESQQTFLRGINKEPFTALEINGQKMERDEIHEMTKSVRVKKETSDEVYSGEFKITNISIDDDTGTFIDATHLETGKQIANINILKDKIPARNYEWLKAAVEDGTGRPIPMTVITHEKEGKVEIAYLQSFEISNDPSHSLLQFMNLTKQRAIEE